MPDSPYQRFEESELVLRDQLALDRTILANERTLLAYVRTSLAMIVTGASLIHFFDSQLFRSFGTLGLLAGGITLLVGVRSFQKTRKHYAQLNGQSD